MEGRELTVIQQEKLTVLKWRDLQQRPGEPGVEEKGRFQSLPPRKRKSSVRGAQWREVGGGGEREIVRTRVREREREREE